MRDCKKFCWKKFPKNITPPSVDYSKQYFTTEALEDGTISFTILSWADTTYLTSISYSVNGGDWITFNNSDGREEDEVISINVRNGDRIRWKGIANHIGDLGDNGCVITSDCEFNAEGNIMSLLYGDEFDGKTSLEDHNYAFSYLFNDINNSNECLIVNSENLILPAETLVDSCYSSMFQGCTALTSAPELPATTLADNCYQSMFWGCTSLTTAPKLSATTLASDCYSYMFYNCISLVTAPTLPATTLANSCYSGMFNSCTSLTSAPELPATTLTSQCYYNMFYGCTSLNYIKCLATNISANDCTGGWVTNVAATGTFVKADFMTSWTSGNNGIPEGWTVENA